MSTTYRYVLPVEQTEWKFDGNTETCFYLGIRRAA